MVERGKNVLFYSVLDTLIAGVRVPDHLGKVLPSGSFYCLLSERILFSYLPISSAP